MASLSKHTAPYTVQAGQPLVWIVCMILSGLVAHAQNQVQVTINLMPPYSAYLQDYAGAGQQIQVIVRNTTQTALDVRLQGRVEGDNGVLIQTLPNFRPTRPLRLAPGETRILTRADLEGSFDLSQISAEGISKDLLYQGKPLPEGTYQVCIQAFDNRTSQPLSSGFPLGCSPPFSVRIIEPPILMAPLCDTEVMPTTPQATVFSWAPPVGVLPTQVSYTIRIIELPLTTVDPNVFIDAVALPPTGIEVKNLPTNSFLYGPQYLPLKRGKRYAWRVQAIDRTGKLNLLNDGKSPVCAFQYGPADTLAATGPIEPQLVFINPPASSIRRLPKLPVGVGNLFKLSWKPEPAFAANVVKLFNLNVGKLTKQSGKTLTDLLSTLSYSVRIYDRTANKLVLNRQVKTEYLELEKTELPAAMVTGKDYRAEVSMLGFTPVQLKKMGFPENQRIEADPRLFSLVAEDKGDPTDSLTIKGTLVFRYPGESGAGHVLPNTQIMLEKIFPNKYRGTIAYGQSDAAGNYSIRVLRSVLHGNDTTQLQTRCMIQVANPFIQTLNDDGYYQNNTEGTFLINRSQTGIFSVEGITFLASGYRLAVTVRQAYQNWPGAPDVKLDGKRLIMYRKPGQANYDKYRLPAEIQTPDSPTPMTATIGSNTTPFKPGTSIGPVTGSFTQAQYNNPTPDKNRAAVEKAGFVYLGSATVQNSGGTYVAQFDRLVYNVTATDRYLIYCPDCDQQPQDAESFSFLAPKTKLTPESARVESYTLNIQTTEAPTVTFTGKLTYKFADAGQAGAQTKPLPNTPVHLQVVYRNSTDAANTFSTLVPSYPELTTFHQDLSPLLASAVTSSDGSFTFSVKLTKPLPLGMLPATQPYGSGEFYNSAKVFIRALRVVVDNPYYASPATTFGDEASEQIKPLGTYDLGAVTAVVRSYNLNVQINSDTTGLSKVLAQQAGVRQALSGVRVSVLRLPKPTFPGPNLSPPADEGSGVKTTRTFSMPFFDPVTYTVIATDKSDANGTVSFPRMVMANGNDDAYFIATESSVDGLNNYNLVSLKRITVTEGWGATYTPYPTDAEKQQAIKLGKVIKNGADVNCKTVWYVVHHKGAINGGTDDKYGPFDPNTPDGANMIAQYQAISAKQNKPDDYYQVYPYDQCSKADTYWVGDKLHDSKTNDKVLLKQINSRYTPEFADQYTSFSSDVVKRFLQPGQPVINVRVVDKTNPTQGIKGASVILVYTDTQGKAHLDIQFTGDNGWIPKPFVAVPGTNAKLSIYADGYLFNGAADDNGNPMSVALSDQVVTIGTLLLGQNAYYPRMLMQPNTRVIGTTSDADSTINGTAKAPVEAYVQIDNGYFFKTSNLFGKQNFYAYMPGGKADSLKIFPVNISYFNEYRLIKNLPKPVPSNVAGEKGVFVVNAGEIPISQRDHRIMFVLMDKATKDIISNGTVRLFGRTDPQSTFQPAAGEDAIKVKFKNVSVENLFVEVSAPGYVTKTQSVTNTESKTNTVQVVHLEAANYIKGVVVVKTADGKETPLPGADVFVAGGNNAPSPYSTKAGPGGSFTLAVGKQLTDVTIQATYSSEGAAPASGSNTGSSNQVSNGSIQTSGQGTFSSLPANGQNKPGTFQPGAQVNNVAVLTNTGDSYIGATEKNYGLPQAPASSLKLTLTPFNSYKITSLWGFPVKVESFTALANNRVQVSGEVLLSNPAFGPFAIIDPDVHVRFEKIQFKPSAVDPTQGEPVDEIVSLKTGVLDNLGYYDKAWKPGQTPIYNIRLTAMASGFWGGSLTIERKKGSNTGVVYAQAQVIDNSFTFSENLFSYEKGQFFLYDPAVSGQPGALPYVVAFDAGGNNIKRSDFGLCRKDGKPMTMKLLAFDATSSLEGSRLVGDQIQLNPTLHCTIKDANPSSISVTVGKLILRNNTVDAKSGDTPLTFSLAGNWSVEVRNWKLDYKQGGFYAEEGLVKTGKVDVPISLFNLRADHFQLEVQPTSTLDLAGVAKLTVNGKAIFGFDPATGSDMKGHWSLVVVPKNANKPAASLGPDSGLPGLTKGLDFETVSLLDNGEDVLTFGAGSKSFDFFGGVIQVRPKTIETGKDYFAFDAGMSTQIPNAPQDAQMRFVYAKPAGQSAVTLKTIMPTEYKIDTKGQIAFKAGDIVDPDGSQRKAFYFANGVMAIRGMAEEPDKLRLGDPSHNALLLVYSKQNGFTQITHDRDLDLTNPSVLLGLTQKQLDDDKWKIKPLAIDLGGKSFQSMYCHQRVTGNTWDLLTFSGIPGGFEGIDPTEDNRIAFTAYGEIKAENQKFQPKGINSGNGTVGKDGSKIGASGVGTPFGNLELVYDMATKRFTGTLKVPGLAIGTEGMSAEGTAQIRIDPQGFYFVLGGMIHDVPIIVPVDLKGGVMVGWYGSNDLGEANDILFAYSHRKALPCSFTSGFKGFFCVGEIPVPIVGSFKSELEVPGVGGYKVAMDAYVDGYLFANYDGGVLSWGSGLDVSSHAYAYGQILVVSASGDLYMSGSANATMSLQSGQADVDLKLNMSSGFGVSLSVDPPGTLLDATVSTSADFCLTLSGHASYKRGDGFSVKPDVDCKFEKCPSGCTSNDNP